MKIRNKNRTSRTNRKTTRRLKRTRILRGGRNWSNIIRRLTNRRRNSKHKHKRKSSFSDLEPHWTFDG
jgi:hypothetical protein